MKFYRMSEHTVLIFVAIGTGASANAFMVHFLLVLYFKNLRHALGQLLSTTAAIRPAHLTPWGCTVVYRNKGLSLQTVRMSLRASAFTEAD